MGTHRATIVLSSAPSVSAIQEHRTADIFVESIFWRTSKTHHLVPFEAFTRCWEMRAPIYVKFHILCLSNTQKDVGWAVYNHVTIRLCIPIEGTKLFQPNQGSSHSHRHIYERQKLKSTKETCSDMLPSDTKQDFIRAAAIAAVSEALPLNFAFNKLGIRLVADALIKIDQKYSKSRKINFKSLMRSGTTVYSQSPGQGDRIYSGRHCRCTKMLLWSILWWPQSRYCGKGILHVYCKLSKHSTCSG